MNAEFAEHSWIDKPQFASGSEPRNEMSVLRNFRAQVHKPPCVPSFRDGRSTAAEGRDAACRGLTRAPRLPFLRRHLSRQIEYNVLSRRCTRRICLPSRVGCDHSGRRFERLLSGPDPDRLDDVAGDALVEAAHNGFNLRKFRHEVRIQDQCSEGLAQRSAQCTQVVTEN